MRAALFGAVLMASVFEECREDCQDFVASPVEGRYRLSGSTQPGWPDASVVVSEDEVVMNYSRPDGTRFRASYRVREKHEH